MKAQLSEKKLAMLTAVELMLFLYMSVQALAVVMVHLLG